MEEQKQVTQAFQDGGTVATEDGKDQGMEYLESHLRESRFCCGVNGKPPEDCQQVRDRRLGADSGLPCSIFAFWHLLSFTALHNSYI